MNALIFLKKRFRKMGQFRVSRGFFNTLSDKNRAFSKSEGLSVAEAPAQPTQEPEPTPISQPDMPLEHHHKSRWGSVSVIVGLVIAAVGALAAVIVVPEVRVWIGLDKPPQQREPIQQNIQGSPGAIQAGRDVNIGNPAIEADVKELLRRTEKPIYEKLRARFPRGYALLYADPRQRMIYEVRDHSVEIDWSALALVELSDHSISIRGPDIRGATFTKPGMRSARFVGATSAAVSETPQGSFQVVFQVLATTSDGVVAVVGACASSMPACPLSGS